MLAERRQQHRNDCRNVVSEIVYEPATVPAMLVKFISNVILILAYIWERAVIYLWKCISGKELLPTVRETIRLTSIPFLLELLLIVSQQNTLRTRHLFGDQSSRILWDSEIHFIHNVGKTAVVDQLQTVELTPALSNTNKSNLLAPEGSNFIFCSNSKICYHW